MDFRQNVVFLYKEVLHDIVKHAGASRVSLGVGVQRGVLEIEVSGDGVGFDPETVPAGNRLNVMKRRAEVMDGRLEIDSKGVRELGLHWGRRWSKRPARFSILDILPLQCR